MKTISTPEHVSRIIRYAWDDRTTFEQIEERTGLTEKQVIEVMRRELKPSSFACGENVFVAESPSIASCLSSI